MKNLSLKTKIIGIIIIFFAILAITIYLYFSQKKTIRQTPIAITNSVPTEGSVNVSVFDSITINFNQTIDPASLYISSEPSENWDVVQRTQNSVVIEHNQYLKVATLYRITILQKGTLVGTLNFETAHDQNDPRQLQSLQSELDKNYPLASLTPYQTLNYRVVYSAPLTLEIDIKDPNVIQQNIIQEVQSWVKSNGVDPTTHKYDIVLPSPTP